MSGHQGGIHHRCSGKCCVNDQPGSPKAYLRRNLQLISVQDQISRIKQHRQSPRPTHDPTLPSHNRRPAFTSGSPMSSTVLFRILSGVLLPSRSEKRATIVATIVGLQMRLSPPTRLANHSRPGGPGQSSTTSMETGPSSPRGYSADPHTTVHGPPPLSQSPPPFVMIT